MQEKQIRKSKRGEKMELQTGIDIIEVDRIQEAIEKQGNKFLNHV